MNVSPFIFQSLSFRASLLFILILGLLFGGGCRPKSQKKTPLPGDKIYPVSVLNVSLEEIPDILEIKGSFVPSNRLDVKSQVDGKIATVSVHEGQPVAVGDLMATISPETLNLLLEKQKADLKEAEARAEANLPLRVAPIQGFLPIRPPETSPATQPSAAPESPRPPTNPDEVGEEPPTPTPSPAAPPEKSQALARAEEANIDRIKAEIALTEKKIESGNLRADLAGIIGKKNVTEGSVVNPGDVLFQIVKLDPIQLSVFLPKESVVNLKAGDKFEVVANELPGQALSGEVVMVAPEADPQNKNYEVKISLANPQQKIKGGMEGKINLLSSQIRKGTMVPADSIVQKDGKNYVYIVRDQVAHRTEVEVGKKIGEKVEVKKGVKVGDPVVLKGQVTFDEEQEFVKVESM